MFCNYVPLKVENGEPTKRPDVSNWTQYQKERYKSYITPGAPRGIVCGKISEGLEVIDFDKHGDKVLFNDFIDLVDAVDSSLVSRLVVETTKNGGYHVYYRCKDVDKNQKLALNEAAEAMIETRGEGGYIVCSPTPGYRIVQGESFEAAPLLSASERETLLNVARSFDRSSKPKQIRTKTKTKQASDETSLTDLLREPRAKQFVINSLLSVGFVELYERGEAVYFGHKDAENPRDVKAALYSEDNHLFCFASSHIGGLSSGTITPYDVVKTCYRLTDKEMRARLSGEFPDAFPARSVDASAVLTFNAENDQDEAEADKDVELKFTEERRELFPPFIVDAVDAFARRSAVPQRMGYAVNLFSVCAALTSRKIVLNGRERETLFSVFTIGETSSGKEGARASASYLFDYAQRQRFLSRPKIYQEIKPKEGKETKLVECYPPKTILDNVTSPGALFQQLAETSTLDRLQRIEELKTAGKYDEKNPPRFWGSPSCLICIDEAADVIGTKGTNGTPVKSEAFALLKTLIEATNERAVALNDSLSSNARLKNGKLDPYTYKPSISALMFTTPNVARNFKEADFEGGFINRFAFCCLEPYNDVLKKNEFDPVHVPGKVEPFEKDFVRSLALASTFRVVVDESLYSYGLEAQNKIDAVELDNLTRNAAKRLRGRFLSVASVSAVLRALYDKGTTLPKQYTELIKIEQIDFDFASMLLTYCRDCVTKLTANTLRDGVSQYDVNERNFELTLLELFQNSRGGLSVNSFRNRNKKYWRAVRGYGFGFSKIAETIDKMHKNGLLVLNDKGKLVKA